MKKAIATLVAIIMIATVIDVAVAAAATSTPHAKALQPTSITIIDYPKQVVKPQQYFDVKGQLTSDGNGLGNKLVYYEEFNTTENQWHYYPKNNFTTSADGSFNDNSYYYRPGTYQCRYAFFGDDQYAASHSDAMVITVSQ